MKKAGLHKKCLLGLLVVLACVAFAGCGEAKIDNGNIKKNTLAVNRDGECQMGMVNDFSKGYYNEDEMESFVNDSVSKFQKTDGDDAVKVDYLKVSDSKAYVTLNFSNVDKMAKFNSEDMKLMSFDEAKSQNLIPSEMITNDDAKKKVSGSAITGDSDYKVLVLNKVDYEVIIQGEVAYFSQGKLVDKDTVDTMADQTSVIIFK